MYHIDWWFYVSWIHFYPFFTHSPLKIVKKVDVVEITECFSEMKQHHYSYLAPLFLKSHNLSRTYPTCSTSPGVLLRIDWRNCKIWRCQLFQIRYRVTSDQKQSEQSEQCMWAGHFHCEATDHLLPLKRCLWRRPPWRDIVSAALCLRETGPGAWKQHDFPLQPRHRALDVVVNGLHDAWRGVRRGVAAGSSA